MRDGIVKDEQTLSYQRKVYSHAADVTKWLTMMMMAQYEEKLKPAIPAYPRTGAIESTTPSSVFSNHHPSISTVQMNKITVKYPP